jgi:hypothetical protein
MLLRIVNFESIGHFEQIDEAQQAGLLPTAAEGRADGSEYTWPGQTLRNARSKSFRL